MASKLDYPYSSTKSRNTVFGYLRHIVYLYLFWSLIYFPLATCEYVDKKATLAKIIVWYVRDLVFVGGHYNSLLFWYLLSTIYALLTVLFLLKLRVSPFVITIIGLVAAMIGIGIDALMQCPSEQSSILVIVKSAVSHTIADGRIFRGFFYIPCGMIIARHRIPIKFSIVGFFLGFIILLFINVFIVRSILTIFCSVMLFECVVQVQLQEKRIYKILRKISTSIYFIHMYVWTIYYSVVYHKKTYGLDSFLATMLISLVMSILFYLWKNQRKVAFYGKRKT